MPFATCISTVFCAMPRWLATSFCERSSTRRTQTTSLHLGGRASIAAAKRRSSSCTEVHASGEFSSTMPSSNSTSPRRCGRHHLWPWRMIDHQVTGSGEKKGLRAVGSRFAGPPHTRAYRFPDGGLVLRWGSTTDGSDSVAAPPHKPESRTRTMHLATPAPATTSPGETGDCARGSGGADAGSWTVDPDCNRFSFADDF